MFGMEIIGSIVICVFTSMLGFFLARRSLTQNDDIATKEDLKPKNKTVKKNPKVKTAKRETGKVSELKEEEVKPVNAKKNNKKDKKAKMEVTVNMPDAPVDRLRADSDDWKKVSKPARKVSKKENKGDIKEENVSESADNDMSIDNSTNIPEPIIEQKVIKNMKTKKNSKQEIMKSDVPQIEVPKVTLKEAEKDPEIKTKPKKETTITNEMRQTNANEEMELRQRLGELMSDLDKQKSVNREESKSTTQTINQLNKELELLKQKMKISQMNEEKLTEELKKRNSAFNDFKQQFVIVQSELTKNIVQVQASNREKEKLENRLKNLEESNKQLLEKNEMFDRVNAEKENLIHKLTVVEDEYKSTSSRFNELTKTKEVEYSEKVNQLQSDKQRMQEQLVRVQADLIDNSSKLHNIQRELQYAKSTYTEVLNENKNLKDSYVALEKTNTQIKQQQSAEMSVRDQANEERMHVLLADLDDLKNINMTLAEEISELKKQNQESVTNQAESDALLEKMESLAQELNEAKRLLSEKNNDSEDRNETVDKLLVEINGLKKDKEELLASIEHCKSDLQNTESAVLKLQTSFNEEETKWRESSLKLENEAAQKEVSLKEEINNLTKRLSETTTESGTHQNTNDALVAELNDLRSEKDSLTSLVEHYKSGLENTESILSKLQVSVNEEEGKWRESLLKSESEAEKCSKELEKVYSELMRIRNQRVEKNELNFAYHCVDKSLSSLIDEMEARMNHFESSLEAVIQERDSALAQIHTQVNGTVDATSDSGHSIIANGDNEDNSELAKIKEDLLNQMERNKALETHCNKYQALIDIGKDALDAEKQQVQTLREELRTIQTSMSVSSNEQL